MRYIIPSLGRPDFQVTLNSLPEHLLKYVELFVIEDEYKQYKKQSYASKLKAINVWPKHIDCMPKKRKWLAQNIKDDYVMMDDDLNLYSWVGNRYVPAKKDVNRFTKRFMETFPALYEDYKAVGIPMKFFADQQVKANGLYKYNDVGFVFNGFAKGAAANVRFNQVFAFTDMAIPFQVLRKYKSSITYYGMCFSQSSARVLSTTGMSSYRTDFVKLDSALKMCQLYAGVVTGFKETKVDNGGGISLQKRVSRLIDGCTLDHVEKSHYFVHQFCQEHELSEPPDIFQYEDEMPRADIIAQFQTNWNRVKIKRKKKK
jgi:hypothetical protein